MVKHRQLIISVKAIYFSLLSSSFLVPIVATKWKMYEFFKLTTGSCSRTFLTKSRSRRRLKGTWQPPPSQRFGCWGLEPALRLFRWEWPNVFLLVALDRVSQAVLSEASTGWVSLPVGSAFKLDLYSSAPAWATSHWAPASSSAIDMPTHAGC